MLGCRSAVKGQVNRTYLLEVAEVDDYAVEVAVRNAGEHVFVFEAEGRWSVSDVPAWGSKNINRKLATQSKKKMATFWHGR